MYIAITSLKKTLGKYIELTDLYIGLQSLIIFLSIILFLMIPFNLSKKNRMYKVMYLVFKYLFKKKEYIYQKEIV